MNEIAKRDENAVYELSPELIKKYVCPQANEQEIYMFFQLCKAQNLNPFLREAYLIKYGTEKATIVVGKETFTKRADSLPMNDGFSAGIIVLANDKQVTYREGSLIVTGETLLGGWAVAYRKDRTHPIRAEVSISEYIRYNKEGKPTRAWQEMPATMIRKVALVQALREAYPSEFGGMYTPEEMPIDSSSLPEYTIGQSIPPPTAQPQRKSEAQQGGNPFSDGSPELKVTDVALTTGKKKDGKEWTKYHITTSDSKIWSTFSGTLGTRAQEAMKTGATVSVMGEEGQYGWELKELSIATHEVGTTPTEAWTKEKIIDILTSSDNLDTLKANWASLIPHIGKLDGAGKGASQHAYDETERFIKAEAV